MKKNIGLGIYGTKGHQIFSRIPQMKNCRLAAMAGVPDDRIETLKKGMPEVISGATICKNLDQLLAMPEVDLVSICSSRRDRQASECIQALKAGKHVLAEKPAATNWNDFNALKAVIAETGMQFRLMTVMVYDAQVLKMKEIVDSGDLGDLVQVYAMKSYPYADTRPQDRGVDGGLTMQAMIHAVSVVRFLTGMEFSEVFAMETRRGNPKEGDLKMATGFCGMLENGVQVSMLANYLNPRGIGFHGNDQVRVFGRKGVLESVDGFTRTRICFENRPFQDVEIPEIPSAYPQDYVDELLGGPKTLMTCEDGLRNTEVVLAAQESADTGKPVVLSQDAP